MQRVMSRRRVLLGAAITSVGCLGMTGAWLSQTDDVRVWPVRNALEYKAVRAWWRATGEPTPSKASASVIGTVHDATGRAVSDSQVLLTRWDGTTFSARTRAGGNYEIPDVQSASYAGIAWAPGYRPTARYGIDLIRGATEGRHDFTLLPDPSAPQVEAARDIVLGAIEAVESVTPVAATAMRRTVSFTSGARQSLTALLYIPVGPAPAGGWPLLLTVYPGPADTWEAASVPLAAAGYAVVAFGPPYGFDLERDVDGLERLIRLGLEGRLPGVGRGPIGVLGGSYSALHVQRLLMRDSMVRHTGAAVLMGAPTDLFDMRRRLEDGTFVPPFGLDQALLALGFPDRAPLRYWEYSGMYHVDRAKTSATLPPHLLIHSRQDDVVPHEQSEALARALDAAGVPNSLYVLDGGSHYLISGEATARPIHDLVLQFLLEHLVHPMRNG